MAKRLPNEALAVRGGLNLPENFVQASGARIGSDGKLDGISVNSAAGLSAAELASPISEAGYPGIPNTQIGVTTVGDIRAAGGDVVPSSTRANPHHATLSGITPQQASELFQPTILNPHRRKNK